LQEPRTLRVNSHDLFREIKHISSQSQTNDLARLFYLSCKEIIKLNHVFDPIILFQQTYSALSFIISADAAANIPFYWFLCTSWTIFYSAINYYQTCERLNI